MKNARKSIRGAPNSKVEDTRIALGNKVHGAPKKGENGGFGEKENESSYGWGSSFSS